MNVILPIPTAYTSYGSFTPYPARCCTAHYPVSNNLYSFAHSGCRLWLYLLHITSFSSVRLSEDLRSVLRGSKSKARESSHAEESGMEEKRNWK